MDNRVYISPGNNKLGKIPNVSLLPGLTCTPNAECYRQGCYAEKFCKLRRCVKDAWLNNTILATQNLSMYLDVVREYLAKHKPKFFRWHVGGDIPDLGYLSGMLVLAHDFPGTRFLAFTKQFVFLQLAFLGPKAWAVPGNMRIVLSRWPGMPGPGDALSARFPTAWVYDKNRVDVYMPQEAKDDSVRQRRKFWCRGACHLCSTPMRCWKMKPGEFVVFGKH